MKIKILVRGLTAFLFAPLLAVCATGHAQQARPLRQAGSASSTNAMIPGSKLLEPAELMQILRTSSEKPQILQVGSHVLFAEAHIPGATYAGAGGQASGLQVLRDTVKSLNRDRFLVIYCGCCPWDRCPNIRPAYKQLMSLGFTNVKVLYLATDFGTDWVSKGYPIAKGR